MDEKQYEELLARGYNAGYLMARFEPKLCQQIIASCNKEKPYYAGMILGHRAAERELFQKNLESSRKMNEQLKPKL